MIECQNRFGGSHILFGNEDIVDISQRLEDGKFVVRQFSLVEQDTELGKKVKKILKKAGYDFIG